MAMALQRQRDLEPIFARLKAKPIMTPNHEWLSCMVASWCVGQGVLPDYLGLMPAQFQQLKSAYFQDDSLPEHSASGSRLDFSRMLEKEDLVNLLTRYCRPDTLEMEWMIAIIVAGCLGSDHLWQDLGLWSRPQLSAMLHYNFPAPAAKNDQDMKWKKFLYKQLCEAEGLYLCRAPSCNVCIDYAKCYGSEE